MSGISGQTNRETGKVENSVITTYPFNVYGFIAIDPVRMEFLNLPEKTTIQIGHYSLRYVDSIKYRRLDLYAIDDLWGWVHIAGYKALILVEWGYSAGLWYLWKAGLLDYRQGTVVSWRDIKPIKWMFRK